jgi:hypothetical protein
MLLIEQNTNETEQSPDTKPWNADTLISVYITNERVVQGARSQGRKERVVRYI